MKRAVPSAGELGQWGERTSLSFWTPAELLQLWCWARLPQDCYPAAGHGGGEDAAAPSPAGCACLGLPQSLGTSGCSFCSKQQHKFSSFPLISLSRC